MKTNKSIIDTLEHPKVSHTCLQWQNFSIGAYQLPNGELVLTDKQMSLPIKQSTKLARNFVDTNNLPQIWVTLPNGKVQQVNPLSTLTIYWRYLLESNLIPQFLDAQEQINLQKITEQLETSPRQELILSQAQPVLSKSEQSSFLSVKPIYLKIETDKKPYPELELLSLPNGDYRISYEAGLLLIGSTPDWLATLEHSPKKLKSLRKRGFSGETITCYKSGMKGDYVTKTLSFSDFLTIWEYFANKGNTQATAILKALAKPGIYTLANQVDQKL